MKANMDLPIELMQNEIKQIVRRHGCERIENTPMETSTFHVFEYFLWDCSVGFFFIMNEARANFRGNRRLRAGGGTEMFTVKNKINIIFYNYE